jgi:hypothetical protein
MIDLITVRPPLHAATVAASLSRRRYGDEQ